MEEMRTMTDHTQDCTGANPIEFKVKRDVEQLERVADEMAKAIRDARKHQGVWLHDADCFSMDGSKPCVCGREQMVKAIDAALASYAKWKEKK
jgi:hypothetical protein